MHQKFSVLIKEKINKFNKTLRIPSDKSCSIRALVFASQCIGISNIKNLLESEDVLNCIQALRSLGVKIVKSKPTLWGERQASAGCVCRALFGALCI